MRNIKQQFLRCDRGSIAVMSSLFGAVAIAFSAFAVDVSNFYYQRRNLQSATDLAAIAAASNLGNATAAAQATLANNGYPSTALLSVQLGNYVADPSVSSGQRFTPLAAGASSGSANAAFVSTQTTAPLFFANIFQMMSSTSTTCASGVKCSVQAQGSQAQGMPIGAHATAAVSAKAAFAVGSGLVSLQGGILNGILGGLLGSQVSFSLMDYQSLASANIDLFTFSNALATRVNLTAITYNQLASGQFQVGDVLYALSAAAKANPNIAISALSDLSQIASAAPNVTMSIAPLISYGPYGSYTVGSASPITASASALDIASAALQIANGTHQVQAALSINLPPIASANLALTIGERPVGTSFVSIGATGATAHTAQTRLLLTLQLAQAGSTSLVNLPIYLELASATAQLTSISCAANPINSTVTLGVTPAVVDAWIGSVSSADMSNYSVEPYPGSATLLTIPGIATVTGRANATITNLSATPVTFTYSQIQQATRQTTSTNDFVSSLLFNLFANAQLNVNVLGLGIGLPSGLNQTVAQTLASATLPVDQVLTSVLDTLGLSVGNAYTWVSGVSCGQAVLVN